MRLDVVQPVHHEVSSVAEVRRLVLSLWAVRRVSDLNPRGVRIYSDLKRALADRRQVAFETPYEGELLIVTPILIES